MATQALRPELEPLPRQMKDLPVDDRGYIVPWFVDWIDGKPEFRAMDTKKWAIAFREKLCWVCGSPLPRAGNFVFVAGPMCGINRTNAEPPSHIDCGRWSARNCPFLSNPDMVRRQDTLIDNEKYRDKVAGFGITRNPGVTMLWFTREYEVFNAGGGKPLITMGKPAGVEWYCRGRMATRAEVLESIDEGFPLLEAVARKDMQGAVEELYRRRKKFEDRWLPKAGGN